MVRQQHGYSRGYRSSNPYPSRGVPVAVNPRVFPSKRVQEQPNRPRNEWDMANFDEFHEISYNSLNSGPKITFLDSFWRSRVGLSVPVPVSVDTRTRDPCGIPQPVLFPNAPCFWLPRLTCRWEHELMLPVLSRFFLRCLYFMYIDYKII
jgi:hypothetical protein